MPEVPAEPTPTETAAAPGSSAASEAEPPTVLKTKPFHVQIGVYSKKMNVDKTRQQLKKAGYASFVVALKTEDVPYTVYKVRVGSYSDRSAAEKAAKALTKKLKEKAIVVED